MHALCTHRNRFHTPLPGDAQPLITIFFDTIDQHRPAGGAMRPLHALGLPRCSLYPFFLKEEAPSNPSNPSKPQWQSAFVERLLAVHHRPTPSKRPSWARALNARARGRSISPRAVCTRQIRPAARRWCRRRARDWCSGYGKTRTGSGRWLDHKAPHPSARSTT